MNIDVLTLFPEMFNGVLSSSILGKAIEKKVLEVNLLNIRDFSRDRHKRVDDYPYGGGAGMVMMPQPLYHAIEHAKQGVTEVKVILASPRGKPFNQQVAHRLSSERHIIIVCGHYEGVDQRIIDCCIDEEISIGDYILTGGELPAMVIIDAVARLLPDVLGSQASLKEESFERGLLEYSQYTRPAQFLGMKVPEILLSGNHKEIDKWKRIKALEITQNRRPDLLEKARLEEDEISWLKDKNLL